MSNKPKGPVVFDLEESPKEPPKRAKSGLKTSRQSVQDTPIDPAKAPVIVDDAPAPQGEAMIAATRLATKRISWVAKVFWAALLSLLAMYLTTAAWDFTTNLFARNIWLGRVALVLGSLLLLTLLITAFREFTGFARLSRLDGFRKKAESLRTSANSKEVESYSKNLQAIYKSRPEMAWALENLAKQDGNIIDADGLLDLTELELMTPLDKAARREIESAARQVATATAIVPLALADVFVALTSNVRMVRRIAEVYGGRSGTLGSWRLMRAVATHLIATGAVGVADDMISSVAGGGLAAKLSRRFGEGIINGALTARVGLAAMDVCRPMPFSAQKRPSVTSIIQSSMTGMFSKS